MSLKAKIYKVNEQPDLKDPYWVLEIGDKRVGAWPTPIHAQRCASELGVDTPSLTIEGGTIDLNSEEFKQWVKWLQWEE